MSLFHTISIYFNQYILGYRYDYDVNNYFQNDPYNNAIMTLYKEGYPVKDELERLIKEYDDSKNHVLNMHEDIYILKIKTTNRTEILKLREVKQKIAYLEEKNCYFGNYLKSDFKSFRLEGELKINKMQCVILSKEIDKIIPVYKAILVRKFAKFLEEKIILKFKDDFRLENYEPNVEKLKRYKESLNNLKLNDIANNLDKKIVQIEKGIKVSHSKTDKKKGEIKYRGKNSIGIILKTLDMMRRYCNNIIHFDPSKDVKFNLNVLLKHFNFENDDIYDISDNENTIKVETEEDIFAKHKKVIAKEKNEFPGEYFIDIAKIVNYIANINLPNELLEELLKFKKILKKNMEEKELFFKTEKMFDKSINIDMYDNYKKSIFSIEEFVTENSTDIPEFVKDFNRKKINKILKYIKSNPYDCDVINIESCNKNEEDYLSKLNNNLGTLNKYSRIKFNLTFERDLAFLELKNVLKNSVDWINNIDIFLNDFNKLKDEFSKEYVNIKSKVSLIESCLIVFNYKRLFTEITPEKFVTEMKKNFSEKEDKIDIFGKEINNTKLFLYLLKENLYNEKAFKATKGIDEN